MTNLCHHIFFLIPFVFQGQATPVCDDGFEMRGNYCYEFASGGPANFEASEAFCNSDHASLASIHDSKENDYIARNCDGCYIGLKNGTSLLQWTDGSPVDYVNYGPEVAGQPVECIVTKGGVWQNINCHQKVSGRVCKKKPAEILETPTNKCPSPNIIYHNFGTIYSPGYPDYYSCESELHCTYRLSGKEGYKVTLILEETRYVSQRNYFTVYEGWEENKEHLLFNRTGFDKYRIVSTIDSNLMLVVFHAADPGYYKLAFFTERVQKNTTDPSPFPTNSPNCPPSIVNTNNADALESPGFPFAYEPNMDCTYVLERPERRVDVTEIYILQMNIGRDDFIDFIDLRTNEVFASSRLGAKEGTQLVVDFDVSIRFKSGNISEVFAGWRLEISSVMLV